MIPLILLSLSLPQIADAITTYIFTVKYGATEANPFIQPAADSLPTLLILKLYFTLLLLGPSIHLHHKSKPLYYTLITLTWLPAINNLTRAAVSFYHG